MSGINRMQATRRSCAEELADLGEKYPDLVVLEADISKSTYSCLFREKFPDRYINIGIAEQNMMGIAAGISTMGFIPVVMTYAVFASMRACEQLRTSICYPRLNVKVCVSHGGITPGTDGVTHQATEDLSMMRAIPNLSVLMPCDDLTTRLAIREAMKISGPVYIRLTRNDMPCIYTDDPHFQIGRAITLRDGDDVTLIANGDLVSRAIESAKILFDGGIDARVLDMHTIKPLDEKAIIRAARETGAIVSIEDNNVLGGLGGAIAEVIAENCPVPLQRIGLRDTFAESGSYDELLEKYGMDARQIVKAAWLVIERRRNGKQAPKEM